MSAARRADRQGTRAGRRRPKGQPHPVTRVVLGTAGTALLLFGLALLVLPGPGLLLVLAGLVLLARAVPAVARFEEPVRIKAMEGVEASVASRWRIAGSVLAGLGLIGAGVVWGVKALSWLPFAGWSTGSSLILSGFILLGLLLWSYRRVHGAGAKRAAGARDAGRTDASDASGGSGGSGGSGRSRGSGDRDA